MLCFIVFLDWLFLPSCKGKPSVSEVSFHSFFFSCIACLRCLSIAQHQFIASAAVLITCRLHNRQCKEWTSMALYVAHKLRGEFLFQHHSCDAHLSCRHLKKSRESAQKKKKEKAHCVRRPLGLSQRKFVEEKYFFSFLLCRSKL